MTYHDYMSWQIMINHDHFLHVPLMFLKFTNLHLFYIQTHSPNVGLKIFFSIIDNLHSCSTPQNTRLPVIALLGDFTRV